IIGQKRLGLAGIASPRAATFDGPLIRHYDLCPMLGDYPNAAKLSLADRLRLIADSLPEDSLDYRTLQVAADLLEGFGYGPQSTAGSRHPPTHPGLRYCWNGLRLIFGVGVDPLSRRGCVLGYHAA